MAVVGINAPRQTPLKKDTLTKVLQGFSIAEKALGVGLAIPKFVEERADRTTKERLAKEKVERDQETAQANFAKNFVQVSEEDAFDAPEPIQPPETQEELPVGFVGPPQQVTPEAIPQAPTLKPGIEVFNKPALGIQGFFKARDKASSASAHAGRDKVVQDAIDAKRPYVLELGGLTPTQKDLDEIVPTDDIITSGAEYNMKLRVAGVKVRFEANKSEKERVAERKEEERVETARKDLRKSLKERNAEDVKVLAQAGLASELLQSGMKSNQLSDIQKNTISRIFARAVGKDVGRLSDFDVKSYAPSSMHGAIQGFENWLYGKTDQTLTSEQVSAMLFVLTIATKMNTLRQASVAGSILREADEIPRFMKSIAGVRLKANLRFEHGDMEAAERAFQMTQWLAANAKPGEDGKFSAEWNEMKAKRDIEMEIWVDSKRNRFK